MKKFKIKPVYLIIFVFLIIGSGFVNPIIGKVTGKALINGVEIIYDSDTQTTNSLMYMIKDSLIQHNIEFSCYSPSDLVYNVRETSYQYQVFIFHGEEQGLIFNNTLYKWNVLETLIKSERERYQYFLSCYSSNLSEDNIPKLLTIEGKVDIKIAFFNFLLSFQEDIRSKDTYLSKRLFDFTLQYFEDNKNTILQRMLNPIETLGHSIYDEQTSVQYAHILSTIAQFRDNTRMMATMIGEYHSLLDASMDMVDWIMTATVNLLCPGFYGIWPPSEWEIWVANIIYEVQEMVVDSTISESIETFVDELLTEAIPILQDSFGSQIVADGLESTGMIYNALRVVVTGFLFAAQQWEEQIVYLCETLMMVLDLETYNILLPIVDYPLVGDSLYEQLDQLYDAVENNFNDISGVTDALLTVSIPNVITYFTPLTWPTNFHYIFDCWIDELQTYINNFKNNFYPWLDTHSSSVNYVEVEVDEIEGGWWGSKIHIYYHIKNFGGNQIPIRRFNTYWHESTKNQDLVSYHIYNYWLMPGETKFFDFAWTKRMMSTSYVTFSYSIFCENTDIKGSYITGHKFINYYFPKTGYASLTFTLSGESSENTVRFRIVRLSDPYSRYLYVYYNGGTSPFKTYVISTSNEYIITFPVGLNEIKFQVYWGGYVVNGWKLYAFISY